MTVRFASFNVENLFERARAMNQTTWAQGQPVLQAYRTFNSLIQQAVYSTQDKADMIDLLLQLEVYEKVGGIVRRKDIRGVPKWAWLRKNRGRFDVEHTEGPKKGIEIVAGGRSSWTGWLELATEPVDELATRMTAKVISEMNADVLGVVEAESRPALARFNRDLLASRYAHCMLIDGNDDRGIDVGIMTTAAIDISAMRSHVDDPDPQAPGDGLFSRDCAEYRCRMASGEHVWVLMNHFKSQIGGGQAKRARQAQRVREIVEAHIAAGEPNVVVMGDLNEGPPALGQLPTNLTPLFDATSPLVDAYTLVPHFDPGPRPGTFQTCGIDDRFDYILISKALAGKVKAGGIKRDGLWGDPKNVNPPTKWTIYAEIERVEDAASDHAAIFVDIDI